jgi:hypothetical protein
MSEYKLVPKDGAETNKSEGFSGVATATYPIKGESGSGDTYEGNFLNGLKHYSPDDAKNLGPATYTYYNGTEEIIEHGMQDKIEDIFNEIQKSNMSKLDKRGQPIYREDGKVMKGPNYFKPNISKIIG